MLCKEKQLFASHLPYRLEGHSVRSDDAKLEAFDVTPRGRDIVGSIGKYKDISDYQKCSIYILKVGYCGHIHIVSQSSLIV